MDAQQDYDEDASSEEALPVIVVRRSYKASTQQDRQYEQTPEQHLGEEQDNQDGSSHDEENLDDETDANDEGSEYASDMLDDLSDGESDFQPGEDSGESDDQDDEIERGRANDTDLQDMLDDLPDGFSDFETREDTEEHQLDEGSDSQDDTPDDEMTVDGEVDENSEEMTGPLSDGPSDVEHGEETEQHGHQLATPEDPATQASALTEAKINRQCLKFITPRNTSDDGEPCYGDEEQCHACNEITCTTCKDKRHSGACEKQVERDQALDFAESKGWKRCSRCGHLIEKTDGCTHMICLCGHEFCYACGGEFGHCDCK
ncbi:E3 ubiquitin- ligase ARI10 [Fusarium acutatum]|uniref:E3 ubiquitin- ligase ARI10 n=1 Tax=Fusarium acutatum TaxID=78861 RepID=A0A8H4JS90_9HYPO|nr:E3 ubiquitin- ligase ARI10 [Fusarium acutatum]